MLIRNGSIFVEHFLLYAIGGSFRGYLRRYVKKLFHDRNISFETISFRILRIQDNGLQLIKCE